MQHTFVIWFRSEFRPPSFGDDSDDVLSRINVNIHSWSADQCRVLQRLCLETLSLPTLIEFSSTLLLPTASKKQAVVGA